MRHYHFDNPEFISQRETRQDHSFKYVVLSIDEELRDVSQVSIHGHQLYPGPGKVFLKAY